MGDAMIDTAMSAALERLTENEKVCLKRRLGHQTAKEMALDLGISPHAVEKRLKMARAKLGVSSSLEAGRLLEIWERSQCSGSQTPDLEKGAQAGKTLFTSPLAIGAIAMSLLAATAFVVVSQLSGVVGSEPAATSSGEFVVEEHFEPEFARRDSLAIADGFEPPELVKATPPEILLITQNTFRSLDKDGSGYIEGSESPMVVPADGSPVFTRDEIGNPVPTGEIVHQSEEDLRADFYELADFDGDGRVAFGEYHRWMSPSLARQGIPAAWKEDMNRPVSANPN